MLQWKDILCPPSCFFFVEGVLPIMAMVLSSCLLLSASSLSLHKRLHVTEASNVTLSILQWLGQEKYLNVTLSILQWLGQEKYKNLQKKWPHVDTDLTKM